MNKNQIDHDRLFKELLETFFAEFMQLFFPDAYQAIDFTHLKFLQWTLGKINQNQVKLLDLEGKIYLKDLLDRLLIEEKRKQIKKNAEESLREYEEEKIKFGTVGDLRKEVYEDDWDRFQFLFQESI